jgi:deoxyguanosine kinase
MNKYIVVEGNIGAGKTTFCQMLAAETGSELVLEEFNDNPFLPLFYEQPERYALQVELFFMAERSKQLQDTLLQAVASEEMVVADYFFTKTLLFAEKNLSEADFLLFSKLFYIIANQIPAPDIILYLHRDTHFLLENIQKRGRAYEQNMKADYLLKVENAYIEYFKTVTTYPIIVINIKNIDFVTNTLFFYTLKNILLENKFKNGLHFIDFLEDKIR